MPQLDAIQRRKLFGMVVLGVGVVVLLAAMWLHIRRLSYLATAVLGIGIWMIVRRQ